MQCGGQEMSRRLFSYITLIASFLFLISSIASLFTLDDVRSALPFNLFSIACLLFSLTIALRFRDMVDSLSRQYYWLNRSSILRTLLLPTIFFLGFTLSYQKNQLYDLTKEKHFTVQDDTVRLLHKTGAKVTVFSSSSDGVFHSSMKRLEEALLSKIPGLEWSWVDPQQYPQRVKQSKIPSTPSALLEWEDHRVVLSEGQILRGNVMQRKKQFKFYGEVAIAQGILRELNNQKLHLVFPRRGQTPALDQSATGYSQLLRALEDEGFSVEISSSIPSSNSTETMLFFMPLNELSSKEKSNLKARLDNGSPTLLVYDTQPVDPWPETNQLEENSFRFLRFPVVDHLRNYRREVSLILPHRMHHPVNEGQRKDQVLLLSASSAFQASAKSKSILKSSGPSWLEASPAPDQVEFNPEQDRRGPLDLALEIRPHFLVLGDQDFLKNQFLGLPGHRDFLLNSLHFASGQLELMSSRAKSFAPRKIEAPRDTNRLFSVALMFLLPGLSLLVAAFLAFLRWKS